MNQKALYKVFIWGFLFLYLLVAGISFCHAIQFFCIGNPMVMSIILAFAFELGLALSLAAVLLSDANKRATLPWILMIVLTFVQVIGNVYSVEKFICESNAVYYQYLSNALLFWIDGVSEQTVQVIISWIMGAILPIIALFMTDMVATNIKNMVAAKEQTNGQDQHAQQETHNDMDGDVCIQTDEYNENRAVQGNELNDVVLDDIDNTQRVEVKSIDPIDVKPADPPVQTNKVSDKLKRLFVKEDTVPDTSVILNAPEPPIPPKTSRRILGGDFESPEVIK